MIGAIDLQGVLVAPLLAWMLVAYLVSVAIWRLLAWTGFYRLVWHHSLFNAALYVVLVGAIVALTNQWISP